MVTGGGRSGTLYFLGLMFCLRAHLLPFVETANQKSKYRERHTKVSATTAVPSVQQGTRWPTNRDDSAVHHLTPGRGYKHVGACTTVTQRCGFDSKQQKLTAGKSIILRSPAALIQNVVGREMPVENLPLGPKKQC